MKCPKCGHEQADGGAECVRCGIIFEVYRKYLEAQEAERARAVAPLPEMPAINSPQPDRSRSRSPLALAAVVVAVVIGAMLAFMGDRNVAARPAPSATDDSADRTGSAEPGLPFTGRDILSQLAEQAPASNAIERARNATVFIQTSWGLGSGFFITDECSIITNRHVVRFDPSDVAKLEQLLAQWKDYAESLRRNIEARQEEIRRRCPDCSDQEYYQFVGRHEEVLQALEERIARAESKVVDVQYESSFLVTLSDGSTLDARLDKVSEQHDLALLRLQEHARCPALVTSDAEALHQGDRLFTVGSPAGIKHVVTSGIFSGYTEVDGKRMLQTDAPINPGNSGGPLIDGEGRVVGINTLVLDKTQGIGFAIPIQQALQELDIVLAANP